MKKIIQLFIASVIFSVSFETKAQTWSQPLVQGVDFDQVANVQEIIEYQNDVIIFGYFQSVSGVPASNVARWNGTSWQAMGSGLPDIAMSAVVYNNEIYAGLDVLGTNSLYKWNGTNWVSTGPFTEPILTLNVDEATNTLYAGGSFTSPGKFVAKLDGSTWVGVGSNLIPDGSTAFPGVYDIQVFNNELYVCGTYGGGTSLRYVSKLVSNTWSPVDDSHPSGAVFTMLVKDDMIYFGGGFNRLLDISGNVLFFSRGVARWNGSTWIPFDANGDGPLTGTGAVLSMEVYQDQLYAAGSFVALASGPADQIAKWNDCRWKPLDDGSGNLGLNNSAFTLKTIGDKLYVGGQFTNAGGSVDVNRITFWSAPIECPDPFCFPASAEISITANTTFGCSDTPFSFTASSETGGSNPIYTWKIDGNMVGTNSPTYSSTSLTDGQIVTCELVSNDACLSNPNATSNPIQVSIVSQVTPTINITVDNATFCVGSTVNFTANTSFGGSSPTYQWQVDGVNVGTNSPNFSSTTLTNGQQVSCNLLSSESCALPSNASSNTITVFTTSSITPTIAISTGTPTICSGANVNFTSTISGGGSNPVYQWKNNGTNVGTNSSTFSANNLANGDIITCVLTSNDPCANPTSTTSNGITMTVNPSVTSSISISASQTTICAGENITFSSSITNGGSSPIYQWQVNGVASGTNSATFSSSSLTNGAVVTCILISSESCTSPANSNAITINVNAPTNPNVTISANATQICPGAEVTFTAVGTNAGTSPTYKWFQNNQLVGSNASTYTTSNIQQADYIYCVLQSSSSCGGSLASDVSNYVVMNVVTTATVSNNGTTLTCLTSATSYQWINCTTNEPVTGATSASFTPTDAGAYKVKIQLNSCEVESDCYTVFVLADLNENFTSLVNLFPNPTTEFIEIQTKQIMIQIHLYDMNGKLCQNFDNLNHTSYKINMSDHNRGVYFLKVIDDQSIVNYYRFIKN
jgi:hypothetical protein